MVIRKHDNNEGFVMRPTWWFRTNLKPTAREALTVLVSYLPYGAQSGTVFPAVKTIARDANVSERATYDALHELEDAGLITWGKRNGDKNHNEYVIHALSRQQIEALCRRKEPDQKVAEPAKSADATSAEVAKSAGARLQNLQTEVAKSAYEVEPMKENQGTRAIGLDWTGLDASGVGGQGGSQGVSQGEREDPRTTAGFPGDTAGSPLDLAGPPTGSGTTAGSGLPGPGKDLGYNHPLADAAMEAQAVALMDLIDTEWVRHRLAKLTDVDRETNLKTARVMLAKHHRDFGEVCEQIKFGLLDRDWRKKIGNRLFVINDQWATLTRDRLHYETAELSQTPRGSQNTSEADSQPSDLDTAGGISLDEHYRRMREMEADPLYEQILEQQKAKDPDRRDDTFVELRARLEYSAQKYPDEKPTSGGCRELDF